MVIRILDYKDYNWTSAVKIVAYVLGFVKRGTNRFYIKHNLDRLHKERVSEVTGKYVVKKYTDSI